MTEHPAHTIAREAAVEAIEHGHVVVDREYAGLTRHILEGSGLHTLAEDLPGRRQVRIEPIER